MYDQGLDFPDKGHQMYDQEGELSRLRPSDV